MLGERGRSLEEEYFRRKDRELIERMQRAARDERSREEMSAKTGIDDPALLAELQSLGFTPETVSLLSLVPLVQVAWAEGGVTEGERVALVKLARARGIEAGSAADTRLSDWLTSPPDPVVFSGALRLIAALLDAKTGDSLGLDADDLVKQCEAIAQASGGIFGFIARTSPEERQILASIAGELRQRRT
jgi:hypothetical protein